jgi:hypothetical protein
MRVRILEHPISLINPESKFEVGILQSEVAKSKIAFQIEGQHAEERGFRIMLRVDSARPVVYSAAGAEVVLDADNPRRQVAFLRMALDANSVNCQCLPLHAAYLQSSNTGIVLAAESGRGKSLVFNEYANSSYELVGDDHIVIRDGLISGNRLSRSRALDGTSSYKDIGSRTLTMRPYKVVLVDVKAKEDTCIELTKAQALSNPVLSYNLLTYLNEATDYNNTTYTPADLFGRNLINRYLSSYTRFMENAETIVKVGGSYPFVKRLVDRMVC